MRGVIRAAIAGFVFALLGAFPAAAGPEVKVADNVYLVPDPKAKILTFWMIVNAGCRDEEAGDCRGIAHYLEHLVFLGRGGRHDEEGNLAFAAGQTNAFTNMTTTAYYQTTPAREGKIGEDLEKLFSLFAKRIEGLDVAEDAALRERNVVLQEYNQRRSGSTRANFYRDMATKLQPEHPIRQSVIGAREDINAFTLARAKAFHERWYARNNMTFVIYGPTNAEEIKPLVAKYIDPLPEKRIPQRGWLDALRAFAPMDEVLKVEDAETRRTEVYLQRIVRYEESDPLATGAVGTIVSDYLNSQIKGSLSDVFVETQEAMTGVRVSATSFGAGVMWFTISATLEEGVDPMAIKGRIEGYIEDVKRRGIDAATIERLKNRRLAEIADADKEPQRVLSALTNWFFARRSFNDWGLRSKFYADVTPEKAQKLLDVAASPGRQIFGVLTPKGVTK